MSNIVAPVTELLIHKKPYKLAFDFAAIEKAEDLLGRGLLSGVFISEEARNPRISTSTLPSACNATEKTLR